MEVLDSFLSRFFFGEMSDYLIRPVCLGLNQLKVSDIKTHRGLLLVVIYILGALCIIASGPSDDDDDDDEDIDPCGTVIELAPVDGFYNAKFESSDCRFHEINPNSTSDDFVDEYKITTDGGPVEINIYTACFNTEIYLLNTPTSCSNGCNNFDSLVWARSFNICDPLFPFCEAQINIDLISGTYLVLAVGEPRGDCDRYPIRTR